MEGFVIERLAKRELRPCSQCESNKTTQADQISTQQAGSNRSFVLILFFPCIVLMKDNLFNKLTIFRQFFSLTTDGFKVTGCKY